MKFGPPVSTDVAGVTKSERNRVISRRIMLALASLLGQEWQPLESGR